MARNDRRRGAGGPRGTCFELLGKKWTALLVRALLEGPRRFTELLDAAPGLRDRVLSQRLKELEAAGIVTRSQYLEVPPRVEYELTERGRELRPVIEEMERWGRGEGPAKRPRRGRKVPGPSASY
ncbi:MAG: winged helix-turn-helix transcriptional regulator [Actinomycetota bacterium]